jgi:AbrB family looped-hinge helix DNA binding protein
MASRYQSTLTRKGQATIPIELREELGMKEGDKLIWTCSDGSLNVTTAREIIRRTAGIFRDIVPSLPLSELDQRLKAEEAAVEKAVLEDWEQSESRSKR